MLFEGFKLVLWELFDLSLFAESLLQELLRGVQFQDERRHAELVQEFNEIICILVGEPVEEELAL